ncbi:MAG: NAD-dependent epimerase/dehydratase family protein [Deltaproteobacteria bacterium]|nr:NAD-dependent epimerase/dehydratase family protein [Deltaproteobacteria bacterium]MBW2180346.1 NAD-dependent epimerase/dehydratase family protein [Deltaproteobacteria bacterium]
MKNIFITGVSGYIGGKTAKALAQRNDVHSIVGIDISAPNNSHKKLTFIKKDVRDPLTDLLKNHEIDSVVHTAYVLPPIHNKKLMENINVSGTENILSACIETNVSRLIYTSSATAYGFHPDNEVPLTEESALRGNDDLTYSKNKKEIEFLMKKFIENYPDIAVTILRPCYVVGPGFDNPMSNYLKKPMVLLPKKTAPMQFVHEDDLIRIIILCLEKAITGIFNVAGKGTMELEEMVDLLGNKIIRLPDSVLKFLNQMLWYLRIAEAPSSGINQVRYPWIASPEKLIQETGFAYEYNTKSAFKDFVRSVGETG